MDMKIELIICLADHTWFLHSVSRSDLDFLVDGEFNPENPDHAALIEQLPQDLLKFNEILDGSGEIAYIAIYSYEEIHELEPGIGGLLKDPNLNQ